MNDWTDRDEWNDKYARDWEDEQIAQAKEDDRYLLGRFDDEN